MAEAPPPGAPEPVDDEALGLAGYLDEDAEWQALMARVHRSIARRELSGQAVELGAHGLGAVLLEYLKALAEIFGNAGGRRRAD